MSKKKKKKIRKEKINYDKVKHATSVDQSDRQVPYNLRQRWINFNWIIFF